MGRSVAPRPRQTCSALRKSKAWHETPLLKSLRMGAFQPSLTDTPLHYSRAESGAPTQASSEGADPLLMRYIRVPLEPCLFPGLCRPSIRPPLCMPWAF